MRIGGTRIFSQDCLLCFSNYLVFGLKLCDLGLVLESSKLFHVRCIYLLFKLFVTKCNALFVISIE